MHSEIAGVVPRQSKVKKRERTIPLAKAQKP